MLGRNNKSTSRCHESSGEALWDPECFSFKPAGSVERSDVQGDVKSTKALDAVVVENLDPLRKAGKIVADAQPHERPVWCPEVCPRCYKPPDRVLCLSILEALEELHFIRKRQCFSVGPGHCSVVRIGGHKHHGGSQSARNIGSEVVHDIVLEETILDAKHEREHQKPVLLPWNNGVAEIVEILHFSLILHVRYSKHGNTREFIGELVAEESARAESVVGNHDVESPCVGWRRVRTPLDQIRIRWLENDRGVRFLRKKEERCGK